MCSRRTLAIVLRERFRRIPRDVLAQNGRPRSVGSLVAWAAYGALVDAAPEVLGAGTSDYSARVLDTRLRDQAFG